LRQEDGPKEQLSMTGEPETLAYDTPEVHALLDRVKDYAIFVVGLDGRVLTWNAGARAIKGYEDHEIVGQNMSRFYTPEDREAGRPAEMLALASRDGRVEEEGWRVRKDGSRFWADIVITAVKDDAGAVTAYLKVTRDLTERRDAEQAVRRSEESLSATLYSIGDGVIATDEQGRITRMNPIAERLTGWSEKSAVGKPIGEVFQIVNENTRVAVENPVGRVLAEGLVVGLANHTALISRDGTERSIADSGAPIRVPGGEILGAVLVFRDASSDRKSEEALRQSEQKLRLMIASVQDYAFCMLDTEGRVASWNPAAELITG
jgi:PAS domain S-box-containing protein